MVWSVRSGYMWAGLSGLWCTYQERPEMMPAVLPDIRVAGATLESRQLVLLFASPCGVHLASGARACARTVCMAHVRFQGNRQQIACFPCILPAL